MIYIIDCKYLIGTEIVIMFEYIYKIKINDFCLCIKCLEK